MLARSKRASVKLESIARARSNCNLASSFLDADISSYFTIVSMPSQAPASFVRLNVEGYDETLSDFGHRIQFHTSAAITDSVWVLDDPTYAVLDSTTRLAY